MIICIADHSDQVLREVWAVRAHGAAHVVSYESQLAGDVEGGLSDASCRRDDATAW